jgi:uncharacterized protein YdhG (YjbR/CyaY superfamily)
MDNRKNQYASIDDYIKSFPAPVRKKLVQLRMLIKKQVPDATERISYQMPAFFLGRNLFYYAGYSKHIGFYPGANCIEAFKSRLSKYKHAKGTVQFPLNEILPADLIMKMVDYKLKEIKKKNIK